MAIGVVAEQRAGRLQVADDLLVRLEDVLPLVGGDGAVEFAARVHGRDGVDAGGIGDGLVVLAVGRRDVHDPRPVVGRHVIGRKELVCVRPSREEIEHRLVARADQRRTRITSKHLG